MDMVVGEEHRFGGGRHVFHESDRTQPNAAIQNQNKETEPRSFNIIPIVRPEPAVVVQILPSRLRCCQLQTP